MKFNTFAAACLSVAICAVLPVPSALAQGAGKTPLTLMVGYPPGGASDRAARIVADALQARLDTPVIVENRTGAGGRIAAVATKNAPADKPMLMLANPAVMVVAPLVMQPLDYDAQRDFQPVALATSYGFGVAVPASSDIRTLDDLKAWVQANPARFNIGVPATGSLPHFFGMMLSGQLGAQAEIVGYRGSAPVITDLIGGVIPVAIDTLDTLTAQHEGGRIRILATSGTERERALPNVPTFTEAGVDLKATGWNIFFAPATMPAAHAEQLGRDILAVMNDPAVRQKLQQGNLDPIAGNAAQTAAYLRTFQAQWEPVIRQSGFKATP